MPTIHYLPDERHVEAHPGETILDVSLRAGIAHAHACGGMAQCSTCRVWVLHGLESCPPRNANEQRLAALLDLEPRVRLACQTVPAGDVMLRRLVLDEDDLEITSMLGQSTPLKQGQEKHVAVMFADIRGFTAFSEPLPPYDIIFVLNRYFHQMGKAIYHHGGYIDNYMGDGLLALFGARDDETAEGAAAGDTVEPAPLRAIRAGLEMLQAMDALNAYLAATYDKPLDMGVGVHYGPVVLGTLGFGESRRLSTVGDAVNLASRIESANKEAKTRFLISQATYDQVRDQVRVGRRTKVDLKGKTGKHLLYEVAGLSVEAAARGGAAAADSVVEDGTTWVKVLPASRLTPESRPVVRVGDQHLLLLQIGEDVLAIENRCPHLRLPLNRATVEDDMRLVCPWHHSAFDLRTGDVRAWAPWPPALGPALGAMRRRRSLVILPARIQDGHVWVAAGTPQAG